jgi:hypothetical protein
VVEEQAAALAQEMLATLRALEHVLAAAAAVAAVVKYANRNFTQMQVNQFQ